MNLIKYDKGLKDFYLFTMGQFVSQFGSKITSYGLILWSYGDSGSVLSTSLLAVCTLLPSVFLSFISGSISDGWDKKKIMLISDSVAAVFSLIVLFLIGANSLRVELLYIINFILGVADSFQNPASDVTISLIVSRKDYMKTSGFRSFCSSFISIFTPIVATTIYAFCGLKVIILIDLGTFIFAFITLAFFIKIPKQTKVKQDEHRGLWAQCNIGMTYLKENKGVLYLILFMSFVNFIASIYNTNLAPMVLSRNGNNETQLGIVTSAIGIAGLVGSILVTKIKGTNERVTLILNIMSFSFLICNSLLGIGRNYYIWTIAVFLGNCLVPLLIANVEYILRTKIPIELQGRVFAARNTLQYISIPIGYLVGGVLADKIFEPFMTSSHMNMDVGSARCCEKGVYQLLNLLVGQGKGSGIALIYVFIGILGFAGCCIFRLSKELRKLDKE